MLWYIANTLYIIIIFEAIFNRNLFKVAAPDVNCVTNGGFYGEKCLFMIKYNSYYQKLSVNKGGVDMQIIRTGRPYLWMAIAALLLFTMTCSADAASLCSISVDGREVVSDAEPEMKNNRVLVPISVIVDSLGGESEWDGDNKEAVLICGSVTVKLTIDSLKATVNGEVKTLDTAPYIVTVNEDGGGRVMVPLRFVGESFGYYVDWDSGTRTAIVNTDGEPEQVVTDEPGANDTETVQGTIKKDTAADYAPYADGRLVVCIDPGHGDTTGGKRSPDSSLLEYEFNRSVAYKLKAILEENGMETVMTMAQDETGDPSLASRVAVANNAGDVDLFVSIHANAYGDDWNSANGWEIYAYKTGGVSELAAKAIEQATMNMISIRDRGVKTANFYVIKNSEMPAVLIEHGFYTNQSECELLKSEEYRDQFAQADAAGIIDFFNQFK